MVEIGATGELSYLATDRDMANALGMSDDEFPEVYATSRMIGMMEVAAARILKPLLKPGQLSVGVVVNVKHLAATPNNTQVSAKATYLGQEGKLHKFKVEAFDSGGKIGEGEHCRAIIDQERLMQGARARIGSQVK
ncbi:MAG: thioesterase family protein [Terriglobales bacterium]